jgi:hypothetical protein
VDDATRQSVAEALEQNRKPVVRFASAFHGRADAGGFFAPADPSFIFSFAAIAVEYRRTSRIAICLGCLVFGCNGCLEPPRELLESRRPSSPSSGFAREDPHVNVGW